jgi:hypothetical protein
VNEQSGYSGVVFVSMGGAGSSEVVSFGGIGSSEVTVSCARPLSLFTGLVLVGEMERPW